MRLLLGIIFAGTAFAAQAQFRLPPDFAYLRDIDPSIAQDMRYATANNFTGRPLPGYGAAECVLRADAAQALARVQASLAGSGYSLKVYDCYRPERAVRAMERWASAPEDSATKRFYPELSRHNLFETGWIAQRSLHSAGTAVDLTLIRTGSANPSFDRAAAYGACSGPAAQRSPDNSLDMGTAFDCFDARSYTRSGAISGVERGRRERLAAAMSRHGFKSYFREWWHFIYDAGAPPRGYDVPITPR